MTGCQDQTGRGSDLITMRHETINICLCNKHSSGRNLMSTLHFVLFLLTCPNSFSPFEILYQNILELHDMHFTTISSISKVNIKNVGSQLRSAFPTMEANSPPENRCMHENLLTNACLTGVYTFNLINLTLQMYWRQLATGCCAWKDTEQFQRSTNKL